jgi:hypothetical protein
VLTFRLSDRKFLLSTTISLDVSLLGGEIGASQKRDAPLLSYDNVVQGHVCNYYSHSGPPALSKKNRIK